MWKSIFGKKEKLGEPYLKCPRCRIDMDKIEKNEVIIDVCRKCNGMWLDDKEVDKIIMQIKAMPKSSESKKVKKTKNLSNKG